MAGGPRAPLRADGLPGRPRRGRVAAIAVTVVLVVQAVDAWGNGDRLASIVSAVAVVFQLLALVRWPGTATAAALLLGLLAGVAVLPTANRDLAVQMVVLFLAATELTSWAVRLRSVIPETAASLGRQLGALGAVVAGGGLVAAGLLAAGRTTQRAERPHRPPPRAGRRGRPRRPAGVTLVAERAVKAGLVTGLRRFELAQAARRFSALADDPGAAVKVLVDPGAEPRARRARRVLSRAARAGRRWRWWRPTSSRRGPRTHRPWRAARRGCRARPGGRGRTRGCAAPGRRWTAGGRW